VLLVGGLIGGVGDSEKSNRENSNRRKIPTNGKSPMADEQKLNITKLGAENWQTWKFQVRHLLSMSGRWGHVDGSAQAPTAAPGDATAEVQRQAQRDMETFNQNAQKAHSALVLTVSESQLYLIMECTTAAETWTALANHFERNTLANKLFLKKKYFRAEMREGERMEDHLKSMKELTDKLAAIGAPIDEEDRVVTLLGSLPRSYSTLVTAFEARADDLTLDHLQQALLHEEQKRGASGNGGGNRENSALIAGESGRRPRGDRNQWERGKGDKREILCWNCNKLGDHIARFCPEKKSHEAKITQEENMKEDEMF